MLHPKPWIVFYSNSFSSQLSNTAVEGLSSHNDCIVPPSLNLLSMLLSQHLQSRVVRGARGCWGFTWCTRGCMTMMTVVTRRSCLREEREFVRRSISHPSCRFEGHCTNITWLNWAQIMQIRSEANTGPVSPMLLHGSGWWALWGCLALHCLAFISHNPVFIHFLTVPT